VWHECNTQRQRGGLNPVSHRPCGFPHQQAIQGKATATFNCFNNPLIPQLVLPAPKMKCFAICFAWKYSTKLLPIYEWIWLPQSFIFSKVAACQKPSPSAILERRARSYVSAAVPVYSVVATTFPPSPLLPQSKQEGRRGAAAKAPWPSRETASIYVEALGWWS